MSFSQMRSAIAPLRPIIKGHPFNRELFQGTLPKRKFRFYIDQDALYLHDLSIALRLISQRFTIDKYAKQFKFLSEEIIDTERNLHAKYLGDTNSLRLFGIKKNPIIKIPAIKDQTQHLLETAKNSSLAEAVACIMPCFCLFNNDLAEMGKTFFADNKHNPYYTWIASFSNEQFTLATQSIIHIADELAKDISCPIQRNNIVSAFVESTKFEISFWDFAYYQCMEQGSKLSFENHLRVR